MSYWDLARKARDDFRRRTQGGAETEPPTVDRIVEEPVVAILIDSAILGSPIWFALIDGWTPEQGDKTPVFYASELPALRQMSDAELRRRYTEKQIFGGGWVRNKH